MCTGVSVHLKHSLLLIFLIGAICRGTKSLFPADLRTQPMQAVGGFYVLYDEAAELLEAKGGPKDDGWKDE